MPCWKKGEEGEVEALNAGRERVTMLELYHYRRDVIVGSSPPNLLHVGEQIPASLKDCVFAALYHDL